MLGHWHIGPTSWLRHGAEVGSLTAVLHRGGGEVLFQYISLLECLSSHTVSKKIYDRPGNFL